MIAARGAYWRDVTLRFQTYNALFLELPFEHVRDTGIVFPLFARFCREQLAQGERPDRIVDRFFDGQDLDDTALHDRLYSFLQLAERQVVLFDAIEDGAYETIHDVGGPQSLEATLERVADAGKTDQLRALADRLRIRIVLTAHPTQFYPDSVLAIVSDLSDAVRAGSMEDVYALLLQMGKTRFRNSRKPTPMDEARSLVWYLENVFYDAIPTIQAQIDGAVNVPPDGHAVPTPAPDHANIELGFWPGGDRDGNPYVKPETTFEVAHMLRESILRSYQADLKRLTRRLTFPGVMEALAEARRRLDITLQPIVEGRHALPGDALACEDRSDEGYETWEDFARVLQEIADAIERDHRGLFLTQFNDLRRKVVAFGFHFATIDLRQDSRVHTAVADKLLAKAARDDRYGGLSENQRIALLSKLVTQPEAIREPAGGDFDEERDDPMGVIGSLRVARNVQRLNGERGMHRYIISNTRSASNVLEVLAFAAAAGWDPLDCALDIVPLFETIDDLRNADDIMRTLYGSPLYRSHLERRGNAQTIMLGFSDGTKDGGYIAANWNIYRTKARLTALAREHGIEVTFFDGRGGPPGRGGGNTHRFYRSLGPDVAGDRLHITVQGQTISSKYGTVAAATHNIGQIASAGILNELFPDDTRRLNAGEIEMIDRLASDSLKAYRSLRDNDAFIPFLERVSPLHYYGRTNIGSRPTRRDNGSFSLGSLRAIPFVGAWSQLKMNVPGYYGVGTALARAVERGEEDALRDLYRESLFFRTLLDNSMQSLSKTAFELTSYLRADPTFGGFWRTIDSEAQLSRDMLLLMSGQHHLLENEPNTRQSIRLREELIVPVAVIQQYALLRLRWNGALDDPAVRTLEHLVVKSMAASVNASRNAV